MEAIGQYRVLAPVRYNKSPLRAIFAVLGAIGLLFLALSLIAGGSPSTVSIYLLGVGAFGSAYLWLWLFNTRLLIGPGMVGYQNLVGQQTVWPTSDIARSVQLTIVYRDRRGNHPKRYWC